MFIEVINYSKKIGKEFVLKDVSMSLDKGKIYGLKGKNGSGKTMLMRAVCGLIRPTSGKVVINGEEIGRERSFPESIGALIENPGFIANYTGLENLKNLADIREKIDMDRIRDVMAETGLNPDDKKKYKKYSLGMKQKLGIAAAIMEYPDIIILDEPTNALDEASVAGLRKILQKEKQRGAVIILSSHDSEELKFLSDEIFFIESGKIKGHTINAGRNSVDEDEKKI